MLSYLFQLLVFCLFLWIFFILFNKSIKSLKLVKYTCVLLIALPPLVSFLSYIEYYAENHVLQDSAQGQDDTNTNLDLDINVKTIFGFNEKLPVFYPPYTPNINSNFLQFTLILFFYLLYVTPLIGIIKAMDYLILKNNESNNFIASFKVDKSIPSSLEEDIKTEENKVSYWEKDIKIEENKDSHWQEENEDKEEE